MGARATVWEAWEVSAVTEVVTWPRAAPRTSATTDNNA